MHPDTSNEMTYAYRPSVLGGARQFKLTESSVEWVAGGRTGHISLRDVRRLRMSYRPMNMQSHRFATEVWAEGAPKLQIYSTSWKSMVEQERQDQSYSAFIRELHRRIVDAAASVRFEQGINPFRYWAGIVIFACVALGLAALTVRALQASAFGGAAFIGAFLVLFLWQGGNFFRRNRPGRYRPDLLPAEVMPSL